MASANVFPERSLTVEWRIKNFSYYSKMKDVSIYSPVFKAVTLNGSHWGLMMKPERIGNTLYFMVTLINSEDSGVFRNFLGCVFSFLGADGKPIFTAATAENLNFDANHSFCLSRGPTAIEVFETKKSDYLPNDTLALRLHLWQSDGEMADHDEFCSIGSIFPLEKTTTEWHIEKFNSLKLKEIVTTPGNFGKMWFFLSGSSIEDSSVNLVLATSAMEAYFGYDSVDMPHNAHYLSCKVSVLDSENKTVLSQEVDRLVNPTNAKEPWRVSTFFTRRDLLETSYRLKDKEDVLSLLFEFVACADEIFHDSEVTYYRPSHLRRTVPAIRDLNGTDPKILKDAEDLLNKCHPRNTLLQDMLSLYTNATLTDLELSTGEVSFFVHRSILSTRSPVFKNLFSGDIPVTKTSYHEVKDMDPDTLNSMFIFLYTGIVKPDLQWEEALELYLAAEKYKVPSMKQECSTILRSSLDVSNVCRILVFANGHGDLELRSCVDEFLFEHFKEIICSKEWMEFKDNNDQLSGDIMQQLLTRISANK